MKSLSYVAILCLVVCASLPLFGQADSLVVFKDLTYQSEFEKKTFESILRRNVDPFNLLMAAGNVLTESKITESRERFYDFVTFIGNESVDKKNEKRIKYVHDQIHNKYFKKYEIRSQFEELFHNGYYNGSSASALYAMAFDKLKIPYAIKEDQTQVYLIVYPEGERIILKSVPELGGYFALSDEFKKEYIKKLREQKIISADEYINSDVPHLFDKHFFGLGELNLVQLAALQYLSEGIYIIDEKRYKEAFVLFEKAYVLYPSDRVAYFLFATASMEFSNLTKFDSYHAVLLSKLSRYRAFGSDPEKVEYELQRVSQKLLFEGGQYDAFETYYNVLDNALSDPKLKERLAFRFKYECARYYFNRGMIDEALPHLEKALTLKPDNVDTQAMFVAAIGRRLDAGREDVKLLGDIERYGQTYPSLQNNNNFNAMLAMSYLIRSYLSFGQKKVSEADAYRARFEGTMEKYPGLKIFSELVGEAYSSAAVYYFRLGQTAKAREIVNKGLKYAPGNYELAIRKNMIK